MTATAAAHPLRLVGDVRRPRQVDHLPDPSDLTVDDELPGGCYPLHLASHLTEHLRWMRRCGRGRRTIRARRRAVVRLAEALGTDPAGATAEQLDAWQDQLPTLRQVRWATAMIRPYYAWLHAKGLRADNPATLLPMPPAPTRLPRPMTEPDLARAIVEAPARLLPWLLLGGWVGLRAGEIAGLDREHFSVDPNGQVWASVIGKGDKQRNVPVPGWLWADLLPYLPPGGPCFRRVRGPGKGRWRVTGQHVSQYCNTYLRNIGLPDTFHALRHRLATIVLEETGDLRLVQDLLGHAQLSTTALYTRVRPTRMARAIAALPPPPTRPNRGLRAVDAGELIPMAQSS